MAEMTPDDIAKLPYRPCVGIMLINQKREVFVGQRKDSDMIAWQMPQGGVEKGEDPADAALRELWEETGVAAQHVTILSETTDWLPYDLPHRLVPRLWKGRFRGQKQKWFLMQFHGEDKDIDINTEHPEFSHWCWLAADELVENIVPFKRDVYSGVMAEFSGKF